jgi:hypothetical protein
LLALAGVGAGVLWSWLPGSLPAGLALFVFVVVLTASCTGLVSVVALTT